MHVSLRGHSFQKRNSAGREPLYLHKSNVFSTFWVSIAESCKIIINPPWQTWIQSSLIGRAMTDLIEHCFLWYLELPKDFTLVLFSLGVSCSVITSDSTRPRLNSSFICILENKSLVFHFNLVSVFYTQCILRRFLSDSYVFDSYANENCLSNICTYRMRLIRSDLPKWYLIHPLDLVLV